MASVLAWLPLSNVPCRTSCLSGAVSDWDGSPLAKPDRCPRDGGHLGLWHVVMLWLCLCSGGVLADYSSIVVGSCSVSGATVLSPNTVANALDKIATNGTIYLCPGTYGENNLNVNRAMTLTSSTGNTADVTVQQAGSNPYAPALTISNSGVTLSKLTVKDIYSYGGVLATNSSSNLTVSGVKVTSGGHAFELRSANGHFTDVNFTSTGSYVAALYLNSAQNAVIDGSSSFTNNAGTGYGIADNGSLTVNPTISGASISGGYYGIYLQKAGTATISNTRVSGGEGMRLLNGSGNHSLSNMSVTANSGNGIYISGGTNVTLVDVDAVYSGSGGYYIGALVLTGISGSVSIGTLNKATVNYTASASNNYGVEICPASNKTIPVSIANAYIKSDNTALAIMGSGSGCGSNTTSLSNVTAWSTAVHGIALASGSGVHSFNNISATGTGPNGYGITLSGGTGANLADVDATLAGSNGNYSAALYINAMGSGTVSIGTSAKSQSTFTANGSNNIGVALCGASNTAYVLSNLVINSDNTALYGSNGGCKNGAFTLSNITATSKNGSGVSLAGSGAHNLNNITAVGGQYGIYVGGNSASSGSSYSNLSASSGGNGTNWVHALYLGWQTGATLNGSNTLTSLAPNNTGIYLDYCVGCTLSGTTIDMKSQSGSIGIRLDNSSNNVSVTGNLVRNAPNHGIYANASAASIVGNVVENSATASWVYGIYAPYSTGTAYNNCLYNDSGGTKRNGNSGGVSFSSGKVGNFWGSSPKGSGYSDTCYDANNDGLCDAAYNYDGSHSDPYPLKRCAAQVAGASAVLLAEYHLDELSWKGTSGEVLDTSGYGRHGTAGGASGLPGTGNSSPVVNGNPGTCRYGSFGGASTRQSVDFGSLDLGLGNGNTLSVSAWVRWSVDPATGNPWANIVTNNSNASGDVGQFWLQHSNLSSTNDRFEFAVKTSNNRQYVSSATKPVVGQWYHLVGTYDGAYVNIYVNGVLERSASLSGTITPYASAYQMTIGRWATGGPGYRAFQGDIDEVKIFGSALTQAQVTALYKETHACSGTGPDHYELSLASTGIACLPTSVTVTACNNASSPCTSPATGVSGSVSLAASAGTLAASTVSLSQGVGSTTLSYPGASEGATASVSLSSEAPAASYSRKCCPDGANCTAANACSIRFSTAGFIFSASAGGSSGSLTNQVAGTSSSTYYLRAVKSSDSTTAACQAGLTGSNSVNFGYECSNPGGCYGSNLMSINGGSNTVISRNNAGNVTSYSPVNLNFDANGNAAFTLAYGDVGQVRLWANKSVNGATLTGSSNQFVVKPSALNLTLGTCADGSANPAASSASGGKFCRAGQSFSASVSAVGSGGVVTPSFGRETVPESVTLSAVLPSGLGLSNNPGLINGSIPGASFSNGVATVSNLSWNEAGVIQLSAKLTDSDYLGAGTVADGGPVNVGRFYPDHFTVSSTSLIHGCSARGYTYWGQDFSTSFTLTAQSQGNTPTQNYSGSFAKLGLSSYSGFVFSANAGSLTQGATAPASAGWNNGVATVTAYHQFSRPASPATPFNPVISALPVDSDGVTFASAAAVGSASNGSDGVASLRYGRLQLSNVFGSDKTSLSLPVTAQYWNGTVWQMNGLDSCTSIPAAAVALSNQTGNLSSSNMSTSGNVNRPGGGPTALSNGRGNIVLKCPYATCPLITQTTSALAGTVDVALNLDSGTADASCLASHPATTGAGLSWLRGRFGSCASAQDKDPSARATFGVYAPETRKLIHVREVY